MPLEILTQDIMELEYPGEAAIKKECLKDVRFPVLVALGIGGIPWYPDHFAMFPLDLVTDNSIRMSTILEKEREQRDLDLQEIIDQEMMVDGLPDWAKEHLRYSCYC